MMDYPASPESNELPEETQEQCEAICKGKTIRELHRIAEYFHDTAYKMERAIENEVTYDDFEDKKKMTDLTLPTMNDKEEEGED